jgi:hypothetical protein
VGRPSGPGSLHWAFSDCPASDRSDERVMSRLRLISGRRWFLMPWTSKSATKHTKKAKSAKAQRQWSHVANSELKSGKSEASAIRMANSVVKRRKKK